MHCTDLSTAKWIRFPGDPGTDNTYTLFHTTFQADTTKKIVLRLSVAGNYACRINGSLAAFGQYTDFPANKTYSETDVTGCCQDGCNTVEITTYFGSNRFSSHLDGEPGLIAAFFNGGDVVAASSAAWLCSRDERYLAGPDVTILSGSLNYCWLFDANRDPGTDRWTRAEEIAYRPVQPRPTPPVVMKEFIPGKIIRQGKLLRNSPEELHGKLYESDIRDPETGGNGTYFLYDLGKEYAGLFAMELTASAGTVLDIAHGEYLTDGDHVRGIIFARTFVDRYTAKEGTQTFTHVVRRAACRYIEVHVTGGVADIHKIGLISTELPGDAMATPPYVTADPFFMKAHEISAETLRLCLHEKYENCPWREQSICTYDARNQMLFGYGFWGNYRYADAMIRLFGESLRPDGFIAVAAPGGLKISIPSYTFQWMAAVYEYTLYSGDEQLFADLAPQIRRMFETILSLKAANGLHVPPEEYLWNYCEAPALENMPYPPNAFYNLYLAEALEDMGQLFGGEYGESLTQHAAELRKICVEQFYDPATGLYADHITPEGVREQFHGHIQMLFLACDGVDKSRLMNAILDGEVPFPALGAVPYLIKYIFRHGSAAERKKLHEKIKSHYAIMLDSSTWWEVIDGIRYGAGSGSLCHGWSAAPAFYDSSYILGITPLTPGYRTFRFSPYSGGMDHASGTVATPHGTITVSWRKTAEGLKAELTLPAGCEAVLMPYPEEPVADLILHRIG